MLNWSSGGNRRVPFCLNVGKVLFFMRTFVSWKPGQPRSNTHCYCLRTFYVLRSKAVGCLRLSSLQICPGRQLRQCMRLQSCKELCKRVVLLLPVAGCCSGPSSATAACGWTKHITCLKEKGRCPAWEATAKVNAPVWTLLLHRLRLHPKGSTVQAHKQATRCQQVGSRLPTAMQTGCGGSSGNR